MQLGLVPIFVDVSEESIGIDLIKAQAIVDSDPCSVMAIFPIHPFGYSLDPKTLVDFCDKNSLILINDVCESLGSWRNGIHAGSYGLGSSFSFYFSHHITMMEGGGVATNSSKIADDLISIRAHGWSRGRSDATDWQKMVSKNDAKFQFVTTGYNLRPTEVQAAIGLSQLSDLDSFIVKRRKITRYVYESLKGTELEIVDAGVFSSPELEESHSWMLLPIKVLGSDAETKKEKMLLDLEALGIDTRPVLTGNFLSQPAIKKLGNFPEANEFKSAEKIAKTCFMVGAHHDLSDEQTEYLVRSLLKFA